jgi:hypothetical protein
MKKIAILPVLVVLILSACTPGSKKEAAIADLYEVETENFKLKLPTFMSEAKNLNDEAVLQYQNLIKEFYCIVLDEQIADVDTMLVNNDMTGEYPMGLEGYSKLVRDQFIENIGDGIISGTPLERYPAGGREGWHFEADAKVEGVDIHYHYGFVQSDSQYFQIITWTELRKKSKFSNTMMEILKSFRLK